MEPSRRLKSRKSFRFLFIYYLFFAFKVTSIRAEHCVAVSAAHFFYTFHFLFRKYSQHTQLYFFLSHEITTIRITARAKVRQSSVWLELITRKNLSAQKSHKETHNYDFYHRYSGWKAPARRVNETELSTTTFLLFHIIPHTLVLLLTTFSTLSASGSEQRDTVTPKNWNKQNKRKITWNNFSDVGDDEKK